MAAQGRAQVRIDAVSRRKYLPCRTVQGQHWW